MGQTHLMVQPTRQPLKPGRQLNEEGIAEEEPQHERLQGQPEQPAVTPALNPAADAWGSVGQRGWGIGPGSHPPTVQPPSSAGPGQKGSPYTRADVASISLPFAKLQNWDAGCGRCPRYAAAPFSGQPGPHEAERREAEHRDAERTKLDSATAEQWQGDRLHREAPAGCTAPPRQRPDEVRQQLQLQQGATAGNSRPQKLQPEQEMVTWKAVALPQSDFSAQENPGLMVQNQQAARPKYGQVRSCLLSEHNCREQRGLQLPARGTSPCYS